MGTTTKIVILYLFGTLPVYTYTPVLQGRNFNKINEGAEAPVQ